MGYVQAWRKFREASRMVVIENERVYVHEHYRYAGQLDRVAMCWDRVCVLDQKTGGVYPSYGPQLAAYAEFPEVRAMVPNGPSRIDRLCVTLRADGSYKTHRYDESGDLNVFLGALVVWKWRQQKGLLNVRPSKAG